jgi:DNA-binding NarL/FixJ family response regulator
MQRRIIALLAQGASDDRVANSLEVSVRTIQRNVSHIMYVYRARSRFELGVAVARAGWLDETPTGDG